MRKMGLGKLGNFVPSCPIFLRFFSHFLAASADASGMRQGGTRGVAGEGGDWAVDLIFAAVRVGGLSSTLLPPRSICAMFRVRASH